MTVALAVTALFACNPERFFPDPGEYEWDAGVEDVMDTSDLDAVDASDVSTVDVPFRDVAEDALSNDTGGDASEDGSYFDPDVTLDTDDDVALNAPIIDFVMPGSGSTEGGELVVIEGAYFDTSAQVLIEGVLQPQVDLVDEYTLLFFTEPHPAGVVDIKVVTDGGSANAPNAYRFEAPLTVTGVEPATGPTPGRYDVIVRGSGFDRDTRFLFGEREALGVRVVDDSEAIVQVPPGDRDRSVDVVAFDDRFGRLRDGFAYQSTPDLNRVVPSIARASGGDALRLDAEGVDEDCEARIDGVAVPIERGPTGWPTITAPGGQPGLVDVAVDCGERGVDILIDAVRYVADDSARVTGLWPRAGFASGGAVATVTGFGLDAVTTVRFGDEDARIVNRGETWLDVVVPPGDPGPVDVRVSADLWVDTLEDGYRYHVVPTFTGATPDSGPGSTGFDTRILGRDLDEIDGLTADGRDLDILGRSDTSIDVVMPPGAAGPVRLYARSGGIDFATPLTLWYRGERRFDGFFPPTGAVSGGTVLYVAGEGFNARCRVSIDGVPQPTDILSSGLLATVTPPGEEGGTPVGVMGCGDGTAWEAPRPFVYVDPEGLPGGVSGGGIDGELRVSVREFGTDMPIPDATVQVSVRSGTPFVGLTDEAGQITFTGDELVGPQTVSAWAEGRSAETYVDVDARDVTLMLTQIPPPPCDPSDPDCAPPPPPPLAEIVGFVTGLRKVVDPPPGAVLAARLETTRQAPGYSNPDPGPESRVYEEGPFRLTSRLGDVALVALCGYEILETGEFVPLAMGVERGLHFTPANLEHRTTIDCNIPLEQSLSVKLTDAPELLPPAGPEDVAGVGYPGTYRARLIFDFGGEGVLESLLPIEGRSSILSGGRFPALRGPLEGVFFDVVGGVYPDVGTLPYAEAWAHNLRGYERLVVTPALLPVPEIVIPTEENPRLIDGYVEWTIDDTRARPDFYYISAGSSADGFPRWLLFVPGSSTSFHLTDFASFREAIGDIPGPGEPARTFSVYIRAVDVVAFDYDDFNRYALRTRNWRSSSVMYRTVTLATGDAPERTP